MEIPLVRFVLDHASDYDWSLQGFGMLRLYLDDDKRFRLHVWDGRYAVPGVSVMHDHPWSFLSLVIAGEVKNCRFSLHPHGVGYMRQVIKCGAGGGPVGEPEVVKMRGDQPEIYGVGDCYSQLANEVHVSVPMDGTVTLIERIFNDDTEHAHVFWPEGTEWVSAEPRLATEEEVRKICLGALEKWF